MNSGVCVCVLLAALSVTCLAHSRSAAPRVEGDAPPSQMDVRARATRSDGPSVAAARAPAAESRADLNELLARLMSRKGSVRRNSAGNSKASAPNTNHRIIDRDYLGWMDFGRRSAEEYEYSS
ncbi:cholecystokinin-like [Brachyhypopomus gauderio]|uniref:cholecystokinin-like n=1 Tax=Brachyhypopomus gauderio TaxID=698409 RepID=UPI00404197AD